MVLIGVGLIETLKFQQQKNIEILEFTCCVVEKMWQKRSVIWYFFVGNQYFNEEVILESKESVFQLSHL